MKLPGPDHPITITPLGDHVVVKFDGNIVVDTRHALQLQEATYPAVLYLPRTDANMDYFEQSDNQTHCPYKGDASYFNLRSTNKQIDNAVWSYEAPYPAMTEIKEYLAFYPRHVSIERTR